MREEWGTKNPKKRRNCTKNRQICGLRTACVRDGLKTAVFRGSHQHTGADAADLFASDFTLLDGNTKVQPELEQDLIKDVVAAAA